jgi:Dolichyl-phosphate-mannose-protein mannosyltransferase
MRKGDIALRILAAALALGCALGLIHAASLIAFHIPLDPNEGWNAYFTQDAMQTGSPYPAADSLMVNNYPPLSFYIVGAVSNLAGDPIVAGRLVSLLSLLAVAAATGAAALRMGCGRWEAGFAALFFPAVVMLTTDYAGMDDPQMLAHAIAAAGLLFVLREPVTPRDVLCAALAFTAALFVKHNLVVLPAAVAIWLALLDRRLAVTFVISGIVFGLIGLGLFKQEFGFGLLHQLASPRTYALADLRANAATWLGWAFVPLAGAALLFAVARRDRQAMLCVIYAAIATLAGIYFLGGAGVDFNAMFDADVALGLCAAVLMNRLADRRMVLAALYAVPFLIGMYGIGTGWLDSDFWLRPAAEARATAAQEIALIRAAKGPAVCEMLSLCFWAGKPAEVDVFNLGQAFQTGARSERGFIRALDARRYALIELEADEPFPFTPAVKDALARSYHAVRSDDERTFYVPNRAP